MKPTTIVALLFCASVTFLTSSSSDAAQLEGQVVDIRQSPIPGARLQVTTLSGELATVADADGNFSLPLPDDLPRPFELVVSHHAFLTTTVLIGTSTQVLVVTLAPRPLFADEVVISGTRAQVGQTPVTLSNISREQIERASWGQDVPMFLSQVPGFNAYSDNGNGIGYSYFTLRGFDMRRTAVSLNGVPLNDATSHGVFFIDLSDFLATTGDIQVQRGVGTSLYGGSAIGGSVDLATRQPLPERRLRLRTTYGSWNTARTTLEYDTGLLDDSWAATFRYSRISSDGYRDQSWVDMWNYYLAVEHYGERSRTRLVLFGGPEETHLAYYGIGRDYLEGAVTGDQRRDRRFNPLTYPEEVDTFFQPHYQLLHTLELSDRLVLDNTLFYFEGDGYYEQYKQDRWFPEYDLEPFSGSNGELIDTTDLVRRRQIDEWDAGWIPRLEWHNGDRQQGLLQAGAALRLHESSHWGEIRWAQHYPPGLAPNHRYYDYRNTKRTLQLFAQQEWHLGDRWEVLVGANWTSHRYQLSDDKRYGQAFTEEFSYFLPRVGVTMQPAPGWSVYANLSQGGREPSFRDIFDPQDYYSQRVALEPEELNDLELGLERRWDLGFVRLNLYWLDFDNAIVWAGGLDDNGVPVTANGAEADHRGVELEAAWYPYPRWGAHLTFAAARNTFDTFVEYDWNGLPIDHSGNRIAGSPDLLGTLQLTGGVGPVDGLLIIRHVGEFFLDNTENLRKYPELRAAPGYIDRVNPSHTVVDLAAHLDLGAAVRDLAAAEEVFLEVRVNNLTDKLYTTFGYMDWPSPAWIPASTRSVYLGLTVDW